MKSWKDIRKDERWVKKPTRAFIPNMEDGYFGQGELCLDGLCAEHREEAHIIFGNGENGWEHVSVSFKDRDPTWAEMCAVKDIFWKDEEECIQIHPKKSEYVNIHPHCLHIWRWKGDTKEGLIWG